jgi:phosphoribosylanthranilate isomerase
MSRLIKICGLSEPRTLEAALEEGADMVGFVHFPKSPRHLELCDVRELVERSKGRALSVVLLVDPDNMMINDVTRIVAPDIIQLHGSETSKRLKAIRNLAGIPIIKALGIGNHKDLMTVNYYKNAADYLLLDAKPPPVSLVPGGNGHVFDWQLLSALDPAISFMLSGGLDANNVARAIAETSPQGVDVSSGVETAPGVKSSERIAAFIRAARAAFAEKEPVS